jgi:hypothetical protein
VVGIAIDQPDKVASLAREIGFNYPLLVGELTAIELSRQLGNAIGALPFTVIIDRNGGVARAELGVQDEKKLMRLIGPLLQEKAVNSRELQPTFSDSSAPREDYATAQSARLSIRRLG